MVVRMFVKYPSASGDTPFCFIRTDVGGGGSTTGVGLGASVGVGAVVSDGFVDAGGATLGCEAAATGAVDVCAEPAIGPLAWQALSSSAANDPSSTRRVVMIELPTWSRTRRHVHDALRPTV